MNRGRFFDLVRTRFGALDQGQVDGFEAVLDVIEAQPDFQLTAAAYVLATGWHESAHTMRPVRETLATSDEQAIARLDRAWQRGGLPQVKTPYWRPDEDGLSWFGRGLVQLTHKDNYSKAESLTGLPLSTRPDLALELAPAAVILVLGMDRGLFTGRRLADYFTGRTDYISARRIVNGLDKALLIGGYARHFEAALRAGARA